ncbi:DNA-directed RNA polymerase subunit beta [Bacillus cereus]|uniref:DNA-directed RNA polymerase subunit beta n=1 Tax=Bacillus cereus TaxID=1396 RepID=UPI0020CDDAF1|nr:DNA-directed RNA polymerase subunit beta [Bacillus cereus]
MSRVPFANMKDFIELPDLINHQRDSFQEFLDKGIDEVLQQIFPIKDKDNDGMYELQYKGYRVEPPTITPKMAMDKNASYYGKLMVNLRLISKVFGEIKDQEVFFTEFPYMTPGGSFIFKGNERVVVTQILKSPGAFYESKTNDKGKVLYSSRIQPDRGTWLYFETDARDVAWARVDKTRKMPLTVFLKALGIGNNDKIKEIFGENKYILATLEKDKTETYEEALIEFYKKVRQSEIPSIDRAKSFIESSLFDPKRYDLEKVGRNKINQKLSLAQRVLKMPLGEDIGGYAKGTLIDDEMLENLNVTEIKVENKEGNIINVIGNEKLDQRYLTIQDIIATINYLLHLGDGIGDIDDIDHLSNRYIKQVGKNLQKEFFIGSKRIEKNIRDQLMLNANTGKKDVDELTPQSLIYSRPLEAKFNEFLGSSQLSQYVDQINVLAELSNKRRTSAVGPGGFTRERAGVEVRDVNSTHYGRICPIETPEGQNVGLINQLSTFAQINEYGFITSPYRKVNKKTKKASDSIHYLTADVEEKYYIAEALAVNEDGSFKDKKTTVRYGKEYLTVDSDEVDYVAVSSKQPFGIGSCCIPFLENDDANRALMGANMQRQGVPLLNPTEPLIGTGIEGRIAKDTMASIIADEDGIVDSIKEDRIVIRTNSGELKEFFLNKFRRTNDGTCWNHYVRCYVGQKFKKGDVLADSTSSNNGELAVGQNLLVGFMPMEGYNYEDSIVLSERLVKEDVLTVVMIQEYKTEVRSTRLGPEEITLDIPQTGQNQKENLDESGIVKIGTAVKGGDILVGKRTPKSKEDKTAENRLLEAIFIGKTDDFRDNSLKMDHGKEGVVIGVIRNTLKDSDLKKGIIEEVKVLIAETRKIVKGDKMAGRHGNKGVVSIVLPEEDMPHLPDGTPLDVVLNPLGVPSRMNIGQVMELHLGMVARTLGIKYETPVFGGVNAKEEIQKILKDNNLPEDGKFDLYDGRTGEKFENKVSVGVMYMMKLNHQIKDKKHARSIGPYSLVTQQPLGGKAQNGGQRFGEMEVWALEAYGAANILQEMMTLKSDDFIGRSKMYKNIVHGFELPEPNLTESLKLLLSEMKAIGMDTDIVTKDGLELLKPKYKPEQIVLEDEEDFETDEESDELEDDQDSISDDVELDEEEEEESIPDED